MVTDKLIRHLHECLLNPETGELRYTYYLENGFCVVTFRDHRPTSYTWMVRPYNVVRSEWSDFEVVSSDSRLVERGAAFLWYAYKAIGLTLFQP